MFVKGVFVKGVFCQGRFCYFAVNIQQENNFLPSSKHRQAEVFPFLGFCLYDCFIYRSSSTNVSKRDAILASVAEGYSELR